MTEHNFSPYYRPDIDGLRALAILPVVIFHAYPSLAPGGFVGVDIFFVISGYLISLILFRSMERGDFSFVEFYVHRILRIFPALTLVLVACLTIGWFTFLPDEYMQLGKHVAAGAGFIENITLWMESGYFDVATEKKPLMHLWSLAIEEQFYLAFPLLVWLAWRYSIRLVWAVSVICMLSLGANILGAHLFDVKLTFLSPFTRFWELMVGGLLAFHHASTVHGNQVLIKVRTGWINRVTSGLVKRYGQGRLHRFADNDNKNTLYASVVSFIGLALILASIFALDKTMPYPGILAILPVAGAALIIMGNKEAWLNRVILSNRNAIYIGKISYPLYLWHWPLLSIPLVIMADRPSPSVIAIILTLSFALAALTYSFVEKPIRFGQSNKRGKAIFLLLLMTAVGYVGYNIFERNGLKFRVKKILVNNAQIGFRDVPDSFAYRNNCASRYPDFQGGCLLAKNHTPTIALLGDSHSRNLFYGLAELNKEDAAVNVLNLQRESALFLKGVATHGRDTESRNRKEMAATSSITQQAMDIISTTPTIHTIVLVLRGSDYFDGQRKTLRLINHPEMTDNREVWQTALRETLSYLLAMKKHVVIVMDWPKLTFDPKICVDLHPAIGVASNPLCTMPRSESDDQAKEFHRLANGVLKDFTNVTVFDASAYFCDQNVCYAKKDGNILYSDQGHLSVQGALYIGNYLNPFIHQSQR